MNPIFRNLLLPVIVGVLLWVVLEALEWTIHRSLFPDPERLDGSHWFMLYVSPLLTPVKILLPGFVTGFMLSKNILIGGALVAFAGQVITVSIFSTYWFSPIEIELFVYIAIAGLQAVPYGAAAAAMGLYVKHMCSNKSLNSTPQSGAN